MKRPDMTPAEDLAELVVTWDKLLKAEIGLSNWEHWGQIAVDRKLWDEWVKLAWMVTGGAP